jgi:hypothetical protein
MSHPEADACGWRTNRSASNLDGPAGVSDTWDCDFGHRVYFSCLPSLAPPAVATPPRKLRRRLLRTRRRRYSAGAACSTEPRAQDGGRPSQRRSTMKATTPVSYMTSIGKTGVVLLPLVSASAMHSRLRARTTAMAFSMSFAQPTSGHATACLRTEPSTPARHVGPARRNLADGLDGPATTDQSAAASARWPEHADRAEVELFGTSVGQQSNQPRARCVPVGRVRTGQHRSSKVGKPRPPALNAAIAPSAERAVCQLPKLTEDSESSGLGKRVASSRRVHPTVRG